MSVAAGPRNFKARRGPRHTNPCRFHDDSVAGPGGVDAFLIRLMGHALDRHSVKVGMPRVHDANASCGNPEQV